MSIADTLTSEQRAEWWAGTRDHCPHCGSSDCGTCGAVNSPADSNDWNRTDWDLADVFDCHTCGCHFARDPREAEDEHLSATISDAHRADVLRFRREREATTQRWTLVVEVPAGLAPSDLTERIEEEAGVTVAEVHFEDLLTRDEGE